MQNNPSTCAHVKGTAVVGLRAYEIGQLLNTARKAFTKQGSVESPSKNMSKREAAAEGGKAIIVLLDALVNFFASSTSIALGSKSEKAALIRSAAQVLEEDLKCC